MLGWLWRLLVVLSLVLCLGTGFFWARSYWVSDSVTWQSHIPIEVEDPEYVERLGPDAGLTPLPAVAVIIEASGGGLVVWVGRQSYLGAMVLVPAHSGWQYERADAAGYPVPQLLPSQNNWYSARLLGFQCGANVDRDSGVSFRFYLLPLPFLTAVFAILPGVQAWRLAGQWRRRQRRFAGLCAACGYDLRSSSDRCPECGQSIFSASGSGSGGE